MLGHDSGTANGDTFWALRDVNFQVKAGEAFGIIGPNGAGKSTLLKIMAGILRPDAGRIEVRGRLTALIEVGAGFHGDLTGRENIHLNGAILGMSRREVRAKLDAIVDFAGVERFLDTPVKRYSTGMQARLGFSIAAHVSPDVLLVDEVLSVGDAVFRVRCLDRMSDLVRNGATLIFVSHQLEQVRRACPRTAVLQNGRVAFLGSTASAIEQYVEALMRDRNGRKGDVCGRTADGNGEAPRVLGVRFLDADGTEVRSIRPNRPIVVEIRFRLPRPIGRLVLEANMRRDLTENVVSLNSLRDEVTFDAPAGERTTRILLPCLPVSGGHYFWNVRLWDAGRGTIEVDTPFEYPLAVDDGGKGSGMLSVERSWEWIEGPAEMGVPEGEPADLLRA